VYWNTAPEYFIVVKRVVNLGHPTNRKEDEVLRDITAEFPMVARGDNYVVFDLRRRGKVG
jgi:hypothetical protein